MNIACISLGCPKNQVDLDGMVYALLAAGHQTVADLADADLVLDEKAAKKNLKEDAVEVLDAAIEELTALGEAEFVTATLEEKLSGRLIESMELKPRKAYGALRVAISGAAISPPLFESMELLGRESTLARLRAARAVTPFQASAQQ